MPEARPITLSDRHRRLLGVPAVLLAMVLFLIMAGHSAVQKSPTFDEALHVSSGYSYWLFDDYRLQPENGIFPQRVYALPLALNRADYRYPDVLSREPGSVDGRLWDRHAGFSLAYLFMYRSGNDAQGITRASRAMAIVFGLCLIVAVYLCSRSLFGPSGGALSLFLAAFSPNLLAHARLTTSDIPLTLMMLTSVWLIWANLQRVRPLTLMAGSIATGLLFVTKFSAFAVLFMGLLLAIWRVVDGRALAVECGGFKRTIRSRPGQCGIILATILFYAVVTVAVIWASYGFRYNAAPDSSPSPSVLFAHGSRAETSNGVVDEFIAISRRHELLPEAYLFGLAYVVRGAHYRPAFLNGEARGHGWWYFFPYALMVKTPLALFALLLAGALGWGAKAREEDPLAGGAATQLKAALYAGAPLIAILVVYSAVLLSSTLNIGLRHALPVFPVMFILAGSGVYLLKPRPRWSSLCVLLPAAWFVAASLLIRPHYLAYFNEIIQKEEAYKHLVDSSLDWGQDLSGLRRWLDERRPAGSSGRQVYLSYFGTANPQVDVPEAVLLPSRMDWPEELPELNRARTIYELGPGLYCVSATMLQLHRRPRGPWDGTAEAEYQRLRRRVISVLDPAMRGQVAEILNSASFRAAWRNYEQYRFGRLSAYLRRREPDAQVGYSIMIYDLDQDDLRLALRAPVERWSETAPGGNSVARR